MVQRNAHFIAIFFLFSAAAMPQAQASGLDWPILDSPKHWMIDAGSVQAIADMDYHHTTSNYNNEGNTLKPPTLTETNLFATRFHLGYGISNNFSAFFQLSARKISDNATSGTQERSGLGDASIAARYVLFANRLLGGRFATAREIDPGNFRTIIESGVTLAPYSSGVPALGDHNTNWQTMLRSFWFPSSSFALSAGAGFNLRSGPYSQEIPFSLRTDYFVSGLSSLRFWLEAKGWQAISKSRASTLALNSGSLLLGSPKESKALLGLGAAAMVGKTWEIAGAFHTTIDGMNSAKENILSLGVAYRPTSGSSLAAHQPRGDEDIGGIARSAEFDGYEWSAPIVSISKQGHFYKIGRGIADGVHIDDAFHIFSPERLTKEGKKPARFLASSTVVALRPNEAFLKLDPAYANTSLKMGDEARRVKRKDPLAPRKIYR